ncbi:MAG: RNA polymerase sigma factor [bacterium]
MAIDALPNNPHITRSELSELHNGAWRWALHQVDGDHHAADDVMQSVYVMLLEGQARYDNRASLKTWLYAVVRNAARRYRRNNVQQQLSLRRYLQGVVGATDTDDAAEVHAHSSHEQFSSMLSQALRELPARQRDVIELTLLRDFTLAQCSEILGLGIGSVRTHYHRGKEHLRTRINLWTQDDD